MKLISNNTILNQRIIDALLKDNTNHYPSGSHIDDRAVIDALEAMGFETKRQVPHVVPGAEVFYTAVVTATGGDLEKMDEYQAKLYGRKAYTAVELRDAIRDRLVELAPETYGVD